MKIKWIFFDLDDTLFDFAKSSLISLEKLWGEQDIIREKFATPESFIDEYHIHNSRMWELHESGKITSEFLKGERFRLTIAQERDDEEMQKTSRMLNDRYLYLLGECKAPVEGARELLGKLSKEYLIGVLTNGFNEVQYRKLMNSGLDRYIQRVVISDEIGVQKPDERLFRYAERETGATADTAIMIGDNPKNDVQGALDAGWKAIYYDCKGKEFESDSDRYLGRVETLDEVEVLLRTRLGASLL